MDNNKIIKLAECFEKLPGIGPRQAKRFVYSLLKKNKNFLNEFARHISELKKEIIICPECNRFFEISPNTITENNNCAICSNLNRNKETILVVEKDVDMENIEKSGCYNGYYYVLGGLIPSIGSEMPKEVKMRELFEKVKKEALRSSTSGQAQTKTLKEIILAFSATPEGDNTTRYTEKILEPIIEKVSIKISRLGRGLSTGTELEYSDKETIDSALKNRK